MIDPTGELLLTKDLLPERVTNLVWFVMVLILLLAIPSVSNIPEHLVYHRDFISYTHMYLSPLKKFPESQSTSHILCIWHP